MIVQETFSKGKCMLKDYFLNEIKIAVNKAIKTGKLGQMQLADEYSLQIEIPKNSDFGDFAVNVSSLSRFAKMSPVQIANEISQLIKKDDFEVNVVAGFINFKLSLKLLNTVIKEVLENEEDFARNNIGKGEKVLLEYVSANPTGPFHIGHGRWAAMGSALANIMKYSGYELSQEFYINDAGNQINNLGQSLKIRVLQELGFEVDFPQDEIEVKNYYTGDYLIPIADEFVKENGEFCSLITKENFETIDLSMFSSFAKAKMLELQKELLKKFKTNFDTFYSELELHEKGEVEKCISELDKKDMLYTKDGAVWFKSSELGDDQDRVIKKSDGSYTYLTADIAYHYDKLKRGFEKMINIWGADHHGYVARMKAAIDALGYNPDSLEVLLGQLVNLVIKGEQVRMGKRTKMITLEDLINEVGVDATRFWMIMRSIDTTLDFDIELAKSNSDENPVFYVQYAHARACSILRNAVSQRYDILREITQKPACDESDLDKIINNFTEDKLNVIWENDDEKAIDTTKKLILKLEEYRQIIRAAAANRMPYLVAKYLQELAAAFHQFYTFSKVLVEDKDLMLARLSIVKSVKIVLKSALDMIAVSAPEKM